VIRIFTQHYKDLLWLREHRERPALPGRVREDLSLNPFLRWCPGADPWQVSPRTGRVRGPKAAYGTALPRTLSPMAQFCFPGACSQCVTLPIISLSWRVDTV
jgi:hypothetical protein